MAIKHIRSEDMKVGEDVLVLDPKHPMYDRLCEIYRVRQTMSGATRVSIIFEDGNVYGCNQDQIALA